MKFKRKHYKWKYLAQGGMKALFFHEKRISPYLGRFVQMTKEDALYNAYSNTFISGREIAMARTGGKSAFIDLLKNRLENRNQHLVSMLKTSEIVPSLTIKGRSQVIIEEK